MSVYRWIYLLLTRSRIYNERVGSLGVAGTIVSRGHNAASRSCADSPYVCERELESPAAEASCSVSDEKRTERFLACWFNFLQLLKSSYSVPALIHGY